MEVGRTTPAAARSARPPVPSGAPGPDRARRGQRAGRLSAPSRLAGVDLARGLAVLGMCAAHLLELPTFRWSDPLTLPGLAQGHASILFATLAGVSLALGTPGPPAPGGEAGAAPRRLGRPRRRLVVRAALIWALGLALVCTGVPVQVILPAYGLLFLVAVPLLGLGPRALAVVACSLATGMPVLVAWLSEAWWPGVSGASSWQARLGWHYPFPVWAAFLAAGLAVGGLLRREREHGSAGPPSAVTPSGRLLGQLAGVGALLALLGHGLLGVLGRRAAAAEPEPFSSGWLVSVLRDDPHSSGVGEVVGSTGVVLAVLALGLLACRTRLGTLLWPLRAVGSMPLTAYVGHLLGWALWLRLAAAPGADPVAGFRALDPFWPTVALTLLACSLWAALLGRGPLEALVAWVARRLAG